MKRVVEKDDPKAWIEDYLHNEIHDDEHQLVIYRDKRELITKQSPVELVSLVFERVVKPSLLWSEILPNYLAAFHIMDEFALAHEDGELGDDIPAYIRSIYRELFRDDIGSLSIGQYGNIRSIYGNANYTLIACHSCNHSILACKIATLFDDLYKTTNTMNYCSILKAFVCKKCDAFNTCDWCGRTVCSKKMIGGMKCVDCLHKVKHVAVKPRCDSNHNVILHGYGIFNSYTRLYSCTKCNRVVCNLDSIHITNSKYTFCMPCLIDTMERHNTLLHCHDSLTIFEKLLPGHYNEYGMEQLNLGNKQLVTDPEVFVTM